MEEKLQYHIKCKRGDVARYVLLPGDPGRAHKIARLFENARKVAEFREYVTYTGTVDGVPISVTSTGIGGPSAAIAVEELVKSGADTFIRVGTCGGMQPSVKPGELVIAQAAIRDEGTGLHYLPVEFPAVASIEVVNALVAAAKRVGVPHHVGVVQSKDSFYGQHEPERMPVAERLKYRWDAWIKGGALASEMECASVFIVSATLGARAGGACLVVGNQALPPLSEEDRVRITPDALIRVGIEAVKELAMRDGDA